MTAQLKRLTRPAEKRSTEQQELWSKYDRLGNELRDMAQELGAVYWAAFGVAEIISDGDHLQGIQHIVHRMEARLEQIADEVRL